MVKRKVKIPDEDIKTINTALSPDKTTDRIIKDASGGVIRKESGIVNQKGVRLVSFHGRKLKHNKFLIPVGGSQVKIGSKGQVFETIPESDRSRIYWHESDFE